MQPMRYKPKLLSRGLLLREQESIEHHTFLDQGWLGPSLEVRTRLKVIVRAGERIWVVFSVQIRRQFIYRLPPRFSGNVRTDPCMEGS